jgi:hypothetical protein
LAVSEVSTSLALNSPGLAAGFRVYVTRFVWRAEFLVLVTAPGQSYRPGAGLFFQGGQRPGLR